MSRTNPVLIKTSNSERPQPRAVVRLLALVMLASTVASLDALFHLLESNSWTSAFAVTTSLGVAVAAILSTAVPSNETNGQTVLKAGIIVLAGFIGAVPVHESIEMSNTLKSLPMLQHPEAESQPTTDLRKTETPGNEHPHT